MTRRGAHRRGVALYAGRDGLQPTFSRRDVGECSDSLNERAADYEPQQGSSRVSLRCRRRVLEIEDLSNATGGPTKSSRFSTKS